MEQYINNLMDATVLPELVDIITRNLEQQPEEKWHKGKCSFFMDPDFDILLGSYSSTLLRSATRIAMAPFLSKYGLKVALFGDFFFTLRYFCQVTLDGRLDNLDVGEKLELRENEMVSRRIHSYIRLTQSIRSAIRGLEPSFVLREGFLTLNLQPDEVPDDLHTLNDNYIKESIQTAFEPYRQGTDLSIDDLTLCRETLVVSGMVTQY